MAAPSADAQTKDQVYVYIMPATDSLELRCAQELFSYILSGLVPHISHLEGGASPCASAGSRQKRQNPFITEIANVALHTGLASSLEEALTLVVPAFAFHNKLPVTEEVESEDEERCAI